MKREMPRDHERRRSGRAVRTLVALAALALALVFPQAGRFLVVEDPFPHAEVGLVLSGGPAARALAARDLYRAGRLDRIVIIPDPKPLVFDELVKLGLEDPDRPLSERILAASGVPRERVEFLPTHVDGTIWEARRVRAFLQGRMPRSLVLITSQSASRRARYIFRQIFKRDGVTILSHPTPYDTFLADRWWTQPRNALLVVNEYQKLLVNAASLLLSSSEEGPARSPPGQGP